MSISSIMDISVILNFSGYINYRNLVILDFTIINQLTFSSWFLSISSLLIKEALLDSMICLTVV